MSDPPLLALSLPGPTSATESSWPSSHGERAARASAALVLALGVVACAARSSAEEGDGPETGESGSSGAGVDGDATAGTDDGPPEDGPTSWALRFEPASLERIVTHHQPGVLAALWCYDLDVEGQPLPMSDRPGVCPLRLAGDGAVQWTGGFSAGAHAPGNAVALDGAGRIWVAGTFDGTLDFGTGPISAGGTDPAVYVAVLDADGAPQWAEAIPGHWLHGLAVGDDGEAVLSGTQGDGLFLLRLNEQGAIAWETSMPGLWSACAESCDQSLALDAEGNVYLHGQLTEAYDFGGGVLAGPDAYSPIASMYCQAPIPSFVASFDSTGAHRWARRLAPEDAGGPTPCGDMVVIRSIATGPEGDAVVVGAYAGAVDSGAEAIASTSMVAEMLMPEPFAAGYGSDGAPRWATALGTVVLGEAEYAAWSNTARGVAVDGRGRAHVAVELTGGTLQVEGGPVLGAPGSILFSLDEDGQQVAASLFPNVSATTIAAGIDDAIYLGGGYDGAVDLGEAHLPGPGASFLAKLPPP